jgi:hypothetical protein
MNRATRVLAWALVGAFGLATAALVAGMAAISHRG